MVCSAALHGLAGAADAGAPLGIEREVGRREQRGLCWGGGLVVQGIRILLMPTLRGEALVALAQTVVGHQRVDALSLQRLEVLLAVAAGVGGDQ